MSNYRLERVAKQIQQAVSSALVRVLSDPRVRGLVTITRVKCAPDLRSAHVYFSVLGPEGREQTVLAGLQHAHGHIQQYVAGQLAMKRCPVLEFHLDETYKKTLATLDLIRQANAKSKGTQEPSLYADEQE